MTLRELRNKENLIKEFTLYFDRLSVLSLSKEAALFSSPSKAEEEGMPYQTLISSVLHKYITDRLVDEKEVLKSLQLFGKH